MLNGYEYQQKKYLPGNCTYTRFSSHDEPFSVIRLYFLLKNEIQIKAKERSRGLGHMKTKTVTTLGSFLPISFFFIFSFLHLSLKNSRNYRFVLLKLFSCRNKNLFRKLLMTTVVVS